MNNEIKTYPDGSQRVGCPPFPELSPKEEQEARLRGESPASSAEPAAVDAPRRGRPPKNKDAD